jgi:AcrR family transcriptional regulator
MTDEKSYHHGNLRESLIQAGIELLEEKGLSGLTLRACAVRAGVSHTAPQNHFKNMAGLQTAIAARGYALMLEALTQNTPPETARDTARQNALAGYVTFATQHPGLFELMFSRHRTNSDDPDLLEQAGKCFAVLAQNAAGFDWGDGAPADPTLSAQILHWSLVHGFAQLKVAGKLDKGPMKDLTLFDILPVFHYADPK